MRNTNSDKELPAFLMEAQAANNASSQQEPNGPPPTQPKKTKKTIQMDELSQLRKIVYNLSDRQGNQLLGWLIGNLDGRKYRLDEILKDFLNYSLKAGRAL